MIDWMLDTLIWTGALVALVLLVRRPIAAHLGAQAAYALWLIPFARLLLPPIELPAMFAPSVGIAPTPAIAIEPVLLMNVQEQVAAQPVAADTGWLWLALGFGVWLTGAAVTLVWRFGAYFRMRGQLLATGDEKLVIGNVRIVESPATDSPLAFGVIDKVIAVPLGFLAESDPETRRLAIAHEMAHHDRGDLIANFAVQPLFALHWFNPLGLLGWRAMRRDQEAACDARVIAAADDATRAAYAQCIARFSAGPDLALAAPMACPVLGEKSIIQRLRSLSMADISSRRRMAGRTALVAGLLALPLTASITYAAPSVAEPKTDAEPQAVVDVDPDVDTDVDVAIDENVDASAQVSEDQAVIAEERALEAVERQQELDEAELDRVEAEIERRASRVERLAEKLAASGADDAEIHARLDREIAQLVKIQAESADRMAAQAERAASRSLAENAMAERVGARGERLAIEVLENELPKIASEVQRELNANGIRTQCAVNGKSISCNGADLADMGNFKRDALATARRAVAADRSLSAGERKRALAAIDAAAKE